MSARDASYGRGNYGNYHNEYGNYRDSDDNDTQNGWGSYPGAPASLEREDYGRRFGGESGDGYAPGGETYNRSTYEPGRASGRRHGGGAIRSSGRGHDENYGGSSYRDGYDYGYTGDGATSRTRAGSRDDFGMGYASSSDSWDRSGRRGPARSMDGSRSMAYNPAFPDDHASEYESSWREEGERRARRPRRGPSLGDADMRTGGRGMRGRGPAGYARKPERIEDQINEMLTDHDEIDATDVRVSVDESGIVTLRGSVDSRSTKRAVERVADHARGVRDVRNELTIDEGFFDKFMNGVDRFLNRDSVMNEATSGSLIATPDADAPADDARAPSRAAGPEAKDKAN